MAALEDCQSLSMGEASRLDNLSGYSTDVKSLRADGRKVGWLGKPTVDHVVLVNHVIFVGLS